MAKVDIDSYQKRMIDYNQELEALIRQYMMLDILLTRYKTNTNSSISEIKDLLNKTESLIDELMDFAAQLKVRGLKSGIYKKVADFNNPEIPSKLINDCVYYYLAAKKTLSLSELKYIQQMLFNHLLNLYHTIRQYNSKYLGPEIVRKIANTAHNETPVR